MSGTVVSWRMTTEEHDRLDTFDQAALRVWIEGVTGRQFDEMVIAEARVEGEELVLALWPHYRVRCTIYRTADEPVEERFPLTVQPPPLDRDRR